MLLKPGFVVQSHISDCPCHYRTTDVCVLVSVCMSSQQTAEPGPTSHLFPQMAAGEMGRRLVNNDEYIQQPIIRHTLTEKTEGRPHPLVEELSGRIPKPSVS